MRLRDSTRISLPETVRATNAGLYDSVLDYEFGLTPSASELLRRLLAGQTLGEASLQLAAIYQVSPQRVANDSRELIEQLNKRALVVTKSPLISGDEVRDWLRRPLQTAAWALGVLLAFQWGAPRSRRYQPNLRGVIRGALPLVGFLLGGSAAMTVLLWWTVQESGVQVGRVLLFAVLSPMAATLLVVVSVIAHEYGHLIALRRVPATVVGRGLSLSVAHPVLPTRIGRRVALAGPLLALAAAVMTAVVLFVAGTNQFFIAMGLLVGASHLYSLVPWHHDGKMFWAPRARQGGGTA